MKYEQLIALPIGTVLSAQFTFFQHVGIITGRDHRGLPVVTSNSARKRGVCIESIEEFSGGRPLRATSRESRLSTVEIVRRAQSAIGWKYDLLRFNCDHFVEWALGCEPQSQQLQAWAIVGSLVAFGLMVGAKGVPRG